MSTVSVCVCVVCGVGVQCLWRGKGGWGGGGDNSVNMINPLKPEEATSSCFILNA